MSDIEVVRHPRARSARLGVDPVTGRVRLTLPRRASLKAAMEWAEAQSGWIEAQRARLPAPMPFAPGARVPLGDGEVTIDWRENGPRSPRLDGETLHCGGPRANLESRVERWLRREALRVLSAETAECAARAGVQVTRVAVGDPKARWGSCSASGAIRYSWRLILAPAFVRRATVAHEVAHRIHMHHGPEFHRVAAELFGADPAPARAWLRRHGARLHWIGRYS